MTIKLTRFAVTMDDAAGGEPIRHTVVVRLCDQLRGELEGKKRALDLDLKIHTGALWAWAAMVREGHFTGTFTEFSNSCIDYTDAGQADRAAGLDAGEPVDPTQTAASFDSASPSLAPTPAPASTGGSTPPPATTT